MKAPERRALIERLRCDATRIAQEFGLSGYRIDAEHPKVTSRYGICYSDGQIKIRLNHVRTGRALRYSSLVDTLCHELAHLRHFNHGPGFKALYMRLLTWSRREGIYAPRRPRSVATAVGQGSSGRECVLAPPRRNGVAVFPSDLEGHSAGKTLILPWEKYVRAERSDPCSKPRSAAEDERPAMGELRRQLSLFS